MAYKCALDGFAPYVYNQSQVHVTVSQIRLNHLRLTFGHVSIICSLWPRAYKLQLLLLRGMSMVSCDRPSMGSLLSEWHTASQRMQRWQGACTVTCDEFDMHTVPCYRNTKETELPGCKASGGAQLSPQGASAAHLRSGGATEPAIHTSGLRGGPGSTACPP